MISRIFGRKKKCVCCGYKNKDISKVGLCKRCVGVPSCLDCGKVKLNNWTHSCGTFCRDCVGKILVSTSDEKLEVSRYLTMCRKCI